MTAGVTAVLIALVVIQGALMAHEEGHTAPDQMPPFGPHGGNYTMLEKHYGEIVVRGGKITVYILEKDLTFVAEDATGVTLAYEMKGSAKKTVKLAKKGDGYTANLSLPKTARRVTFHISCVLDGKKESGSVIYEPGR